VVSRGRRSRCHQSTEQWWCERGVRLFNKGRGGTSNSTGGEQCSRRTGGHDIPSVVGTADHRQRHDGSTGLDSAQLGRPWHARFVPVSIHSRDGRGMPQPNILVVHGVWGHRYSDVGPRVLCAASVFTLDLTTGLRYDILTPRGSVDRRLATCTVHRRMRAAPFAAKLGEAFAEPQRILIGGRGAGVSMRWRSAREHTRDWDSDNGRNV